jgi:pimeloyl-ACP methyl ester carboxylesterase
MSTPGVRRARSAALEIAYEEHGRPDAPAVILLHGFPDDARSWDEVVPRLVGAGYRAVVPYLRGFGPTRLLDPAGPRMAQQAALGQDVVDLLDALDLGGAFLVGQDWGARAACVAAALHPERVHALVSVGGYVIQDIAKAARPGEPEEEARLWYQWYFNTERGRAGLERGRRAICRYLWRTWSPGWRFDDATFERTARSFDNPDFVDVVIHSYRHRHGNAPGEARFDAAEARLATRPPIPVPTLVLHGRDDTVDPVHTSEGEAHLFPRGYSRRVIPDAGHFAQREQPAVVSDAIVAFLASDRARRRP